MRQILRFTQDDMPFLQDDTRFFPILMGKVHHDASPARAQ
jgi:hypothetical protein